MAKKKTLVTSLSIYHKILMEYREDWALAEIALFEKLFVISKFSKEPNRAIFYQDNRLEKELHIKRKTLEGAFRKLYKLGFLERTNEGQVGKPKGYIMKFNVIFQNLDKIFELDTTLCTKKQNEILEQKKEILKIYLEAPKMTHHMVIDANALKPFIGHFPLIQKDDNDLGNDT